MDIKEFMKKQLEHSKLCPNYAPPDPRAEFLADALAGEAGELLNVFKKQWRDGETEERKVLIKKELSDVGNYFFMLCAHLGLDPLRICEDSLLEFEQRYEYAVLVDKAVERGEWDANRNQ